MRVQTGIVAGERAAKSNSEESGLTMDDSWCHASRAPAKSGAGIETPNLQGAGKTPLVVCVFFCAQNIPFMVGYSGGTCARRFLVAVVSTRLPRHPIEIETSLVAVMPQYKEAPMSHHAQVTPISQADNLVTRSLDIAGISLESLNKLRTLFQSISQISENNTTARELAVIGAHLADEWANLIDCEREDLEHMESN
ncbi:hypothetical protein MO867_19550 [Microbulbifer sp. OS29]|uniref:Uncharacterized protein n=1 Tax=Microbulbifer okhotskensis TaxID=2926617 RepID=A0A9X2EQH6_9GAMM|nr:hypothetical protein [Microbulbifer okhotskensis]MCO1336532.1 hypothetical protein [Microbulbifer okhotskensis]